MCALGARTGSSAVCLSASEWRFDAASERGDLAGAAGSSDDRPLGDRGGWTVRAVAPTALPGDAGPGQGSLRKPAYRDRRPGLWCPRGHRVSACVHVGRAAERRNAITRADHRRSGLVGITDTDAALQDWPLAGVIPTLARRSCWSTVPVGCAASALFRRLRPVAEWQVSPHAMLLHLGCWDCHRPGCGGGRPGRGVAREARRMARAPSSTAVTRWRIGGPAELHLGRAAAHLGLVDAAIADLEQHRPAKVGGADNVPRATGSRPKYQLASALLRRCGPVTCAATGPITGSRRCGAQAELVCRRWSADQQPLDHIDATFQQSALTGASSRSLNWWRRACRCRDRVAAVPVRAHRAKPRAAHTGQARPAEPQPDRGVGARGGKPSRSAD